MLYVMERFQVLDFDSWKAAFDDHVGTRIRRGATGHYVFRAEDDPNLVTVMLEFASRGGATALESYDASFLDAIRRGGIAGGAANHFKRRVDYLDAVDVADYTTAPYS